MRFAAVACLAAFITLPAAAFAQQGPQKVPAEPPLSAIVAHFFPGYVPVSLSDLAPEIAALAAADPAYAHPDRSPSAIRADFDGNGHADYAVLIKRRSASGSDEIFVILMGHGIGRYAKAMESFFGPLADEIYLGYMGPGTELELGAAARYGEAERIRLKTAAVTLNVLHQSSDVLLWDPRRNSFDRAPVPR